MPNTKSAGKAMRQAERRHARNVVKKDAAKLTVKTVRKFVGESKKTEAQEALRLAMKALDKAVKTRVIHKNTAARKKSRLAKAIAKIK